MIRLNCNTCQTELVIDDAFAGGVCRCQHCGTIQTVPTRMKGNAPELESPPPKTLVSKPPGSGLDELADIVASSGLSRSAMRKPPPATAPPVPPASRGTQLSISRPQLIALIVGGAILLLIMGATVAWLVGQINKPAPRHEDVTVAPTPAPKPPAVSTPDTAIPAPPPPRNTTPQTPAPAPATKRPNFMGVALTGPTVIYVLDRGQGTLETFDDMKIACFRSLVSLSPQMRFQVIFWETQGKVIAYPADGPQSVTVDHLEAARTALDDIPAFGQSNVGPALAQAARQRGAEILLATGKFGLDEEFEAAATAAVKGLSLKLHVFSVGPSSSPEALKSLAGKLKGTFHEISAADLKTYAEQ